MDKAVDEPKAEQEETRSKKSFPSTQSKSSSTKVTVFFNLIILKFPLLLTIISHCVLSIMKDSSNEISKQASGLPQLVDEEE